MYTLHFASGGEKEVESHIMIGLMFVLDLGLVLGLAIGIDLGARVLVMNACLFMVLLVGWILVLLFFSVLFMTLILLESVFLIVFLFVERSMVR